MSPDPFSDLKRKQREGWAHFTPLEVHTTPAAGHLVSFARITAGERVLDIGCGTGVAALTARRAGARVTGLDLTPELLARAKEHAQLAEVDDIVWTEGDAEALPYPDASFDVVISQFGHMFAPRAELATKELLRVTRPGGRIAFATWPPEMFVGRMFALVGGFVPPPPPGASPPPRWGNPEVVKERLGDQVADLFFERGTMLFGALSPQHYRAMVEQTLGPVRTLLLSATDEVRRKFRKELEGLVAMYLRDNVVRQEYLLTRATRR